MPIAIILRSEHGKSLFRDAIIASLSSGIGNYALLCSGFFQENFKNSSYRASAEPGFADALRSHNIQLDLLGIHNNSWKRSYINLAHSFRSLGIEVVPYLISGFKWHAKIFILKQRSRFLFGIIGSSNITANAFGVFNSPGLPTDSPSPPRCFNYECDVFLWDEACTQIHNSMSALLFNRETSRSVMRANYEENDNFGLSISDRLKAIEEQIFLSKISQLKL